MGEWKSWNDVMEEQHVIRTEPLRPCLEGKAEPKNTEATVPVPKVLFIVDCDHVTLAAAYGAARVMCGQCQAVRGIKDVHEYEWHFTCDTRGCNVGRWTGLARSVAVFLAKGHLERHGNHQPRVEYAKNPTSVRVREKLVTDKIIKS